MTKKIILIDHPVGQRDDRASRMVADRGYRIEWYRPAQGDRLPDPGPDYAAALVYGGAEDLSKSLEVDYLRQEMDWMRAWVAAERPLLGICLGSQMLAHAFGGKVTPHPEGHHEIGYVKIEPTAMANGFLDGPLHVYHWHKEGFEAPEGAEVLATGEVFPQQAFRLGERAYGLQFHPEVTPDVFRRWIREAGHMLAEPGAHASERQIADGERFDRPMEKWFEAFLDDWLKRGA